MSESVPARRFSKRRGYVAVGAGVFIVVVMAGVWLWLAWLFATNPSSATSPGFPEFLGKLYIGFALVIVCGVIGIANGILVVRNGRSNIPLLVAMIVIFLSALVIMYRASQALPPS
jgi:hypothetical protein